MTRTPTLGPNDCCACEGNTCSVPSNSSCPQGCTAQYDSACNDAGACVANTPTPTRTPTLGANDCCQCEGVVCAVPSNSSCPQGCNAVYDSACVEEVGCVANTVTPTRTPTLGPNDCCACAGNTCSVPSDSSCPEGCTAEYDSACTDAGACVANTPTLTPTQASTATPTLGPNDCCVCEGNTCSVPSDSACPQGCTPQFDSACSEAGACVANTPTPTRTPTLGPNDCCQCEGNVCTVPDGATCPLDCEPRRDSACTDAGACVANTPTPTPPVGPTLGPNDCCQCAGNVCAVPSNAACPEGCTPEFDSACSAAGDCVANTPTRTPTLGPNDCCQCAGALCAVPSTGECPQGCIPEFDSACSVAGDCVANTPTPTPTLGPNDCCQCNGNVCAVPSNAACPEGCTPEYDSACSAGDCVRNTPTRTPTRPAGGTRTRTPTMTPMVIPFPC